MEGRLLPFIAKPDDDCARLLESVQNAHLFLVQTPGPTAFVLRDEDGRKYRVLIGSLQTCSCNQKRGSVCIHLLFTMIRIMHIPATNPIVWQVALTDNEVDQVLRGAFAQREARRTTAPRVDTSAPGGHPIVPVCITPIISITRGKIHPPFHSAQPRPVEPGDICAICQEEITPKQPLSHCRFSCGNNIHTKCLLIWSQHNRSIGEKVTCPGCGLSPIVGPRLRCMICADFSLCVDCYKLYDLSFMI
ncbi:putative E3 ubiquitin-protein ligase Zswim2 [Paratrimastix pyriformis]|uniref:E3 ubiquitin-protein ligase Zswim2 n=1 Tax=Paratrimastix pyriformis TaxID=342808 RepID=A0ABQ8UKH0_9EUKA|nr:putative E3 ubiquitin-protein ligase Zswim2 [Paratrimastix pyriformis]